MSGETTSGVIAVIIPSHRVTAHILGVIERVGPEVRHIVVVDDACPDQSGAFVLANCKDPRVTVLTHEQNQGVGGAVLTGYKWATEQGADVLIKVDGDGQMDPQLIPSFAAPILEGRADYTKGNRFYNVEDVRSMPPVRLFGNAVLSFLTKISSGYWTMFDPTNGYTALSAKVFSQLPTDRIARRYFFESDLLFRLGTLKAVVQDIPMEAVYADEESGLKIGKILPQFMMGNIGNTLKRIGYNYFLRDFNVASMELIIGVVFLLFGVVFGSIAWAHSVATGTPASTGTVMLAALPIILGVQLLLSFLSFDIAAVPARAIHPALPSTRRARPATLHVPIKVASC